MFEHTFFWIPEKFYRTFNDFKELFTFWIDLESDDSPSLFENRCKTCLHAFEFEDQNVAMSKNTFRDSIKIFFFKTRWIYLRKTVQQLDWD